MRIALRAAGAVPLTRLGRSRPRICLVEQAAGPALRQSTPGASNCRGFGFPALPRRSRRCFSRNLTDAFADRRGWQDEQGQIGFQGGLAFRGRVGIRKSGCWQIRLPLLMEISAPSQRAFAGAENRADQPPLTGFLRASRQRDLLRRCLGSIEDFLKIFSGIVVDARGVRAPVSAPTPITTLEV